MWGDIVDVLYEFKVTNSHCHTTAPKLLVAYFYSSAMADLCYSN